MNISSAGQARNNLPAASNQQVSEVKESAPAAEPKKQAPESPAPSVMEPVDVYERNGRVPPKSPAAPPAKDKEEGLRCTVDTDEVDAEIQKLKDEVSKLEQEIQRSSKEQDPEETEKLESKLANAESELSRKDTDAYRRANAKYTYGEGRPPGA